MAEYSERHYGHRQWKLRNPHVIVEHMAETSTAAAVYNTFAPTARRRARRAAQRLLALRHLPVGKIFQLVSTKIRCRHTVGLNWTAIGSSTPDSPTPTCSTTRRRCAPHCG